MTSLEWFKILAIVNAVMLLGISAFILLLESRVSMLVEISTHLADIVQNNTESIKIITKYKRED